MRKGGGFGVVILLVVVAIVLWLVARAWDGMAPAAHQAAGFESARPVPDHGQPAAGDALRSGGLPDLNEMRESTAGHAGQVQDALEAIE